MHDAPVVHQQDHARLQLDPELTLLPADDALQSSVAAVELSNVCGRDRVQGCPVIGVESGTTGIF